MSMEEIYFMAATSCSQHCEPASPSQQTHCPNASYSGSVTKLAGTQVLAPEGLP